MKFYLRDSLFYNELIRDWSSRVHDAENKIYDTMLKKLILQYLDYS